MNWLHSATQINSPNCDDRPDDTDVDMLVIHNISLPPGEYQNNYVEQFFQNCLDPSEHSYFEEVASLKVSSHIYVRRDGRVVQFVPFDKRAWHAGVSSWKGRDQCNDYSIGVELEGCDEESFTDQQYMVLSDLTKEIQNNFSRISNDRIVGHSDISPGRKTDPGPCFDWGRYMSFLQEGS